MKTMTKMIPMREKVSFSRYEKYFSQKKYFVPFKEANSNSSLPRKWKGLGRTFNKAFELPSLEYPQRPKVGKQLSYLMSSYSSSPRCGEEAWLLKCLRKVTELRWLSQNWDSHNAEPPNAIAINHARLILGALVQINFPPSHVTPSVENGVGISFISASKYADIECFNTGEILAVTSTGQGKPTVWEVGSNSAALRSAVRKIRDFIRG